MFLCFWSITVTNEFCWQLEQPFLGKKYISMGSQPKRITKKNGHNRESPLGVLDYRLLMKETWNATWKLLPMIYCGLAVFDIAEWKSLL